MKILLTSIIVFLFIDFCYLIFGFLIYGLGLLFKKLSLLRFGHRLIAYGDAGLFGAHSKWLEKRCFRGCYCSDCDLWTCSGWRKKT